MLSWIWWVAMVIETEEGMNLMKSFNSPSKT